MSICEIAEVRYNVKDLDYEKILKYYLPATYNEFKDIFFRK